MSTHSYVECVISIWCHHYKEETPWQKNKSPDKWKLGARVKQTCLGTDGLKKGTAEEEERMGRYSIQEYLLIMVRTRGSYMPLIPLLRRSERYCVQECLLVGINTHLPSI